MIINRIRDYILHRKLSFNKFEISLEVSHGSISNAWKHKKNIGSNVIEKILTTYPDLSSEWLLRGQGQMLLVSNEKKYEEISKPSEDDFGLNDVLLDLSIRYFGVKNKRELYEILNQPNITLEETILSTWQDKYGHELKSINRQLMTLFTAKLNNEKKKTRDFRDSKAG